MPIAHNKDTGETLYLDGETWKPAQIANHPDGSRVAFDGQTWQTISALPASPVQPTAAQTEPGTDMGTTAAAVQGFNSVIPFGERITAGLGAAGAKVYDSTLGDNVLEGKSISDLYKQARLDQKKTAESNTTANLLGTGAGVVTSLPLLGAKVLGGGLKATTVAANAGTGAKAINLAKNVGKSVAVAAPIGAVSAYGGSRNDLDSKAAFEDAKTGGLLSAGLGAAAPIAGATVGKITRPNVSGTVKKLASVAKNKFGIDLSLDQIAPSFVRDTMQKVSQNVPGSGVESFMDKQRMQWMRAAAKTLGEDADNLSPEVVNNYLDRAANDFIQPLAGKTIAFAPEDIGKIAQIAQNARSEIDASLHAVVKANANDLLKNLRLDKGATHSSVGDVLISGDKLASIRSELVKKLPNIAGGARKHVAKLVDVLNDVTDQHLSAAELERLTTARKQWRNYKTMEPLLQKSPTGEINPTELMTQIKASKFIEPQKTPTGQDDLVDLARVGKQFMAKKGGSDTTEKTALLQTVRKIGKGVADTATVGAGAITNLPLTAAALAGNRAYQALINQSPRVVRKLVQDAPKSTKAAAIAGILGAKTVTNSNKQKPTEEK